MEYNVRAEAGKQYLKYFKVWFILAGILLVLSLAVLVWNVLRKDDGRINTEAPQERVYDLADVLTDQEEEDLRRLIAETEAKIRCDIVLVTINQPVEGNNLDPSYGYRYTDWDGNMMDLADDFYDSHNYGFDKVHGDGVLLLDNWYTDENGSQKGSWLSTCGRVENRFGYGDIDSLLSEVEWYIEMDAYMGYAAYVKYMAKAMADRSVELRKVFWLDGFVAASLAAIIFVLLKLRNKEGVKTVQAVTYVADGKPQVNYATDDFIRKTTTTRHIQTDHGGGGGGSHGGGGHHTSSGGVSHGGGGHRR